MKAVVAVFNYVGTFVSWFIESSIPNFITLHCRNNSLLVKSRICECEIATDIATAMCNIRKGPYLNVVYTIFGILDPSHLSASWQDS